jgi:excisionase family DNA binding protein
VLCQRAFANPEGPEPVTHNVSEPDRDYLFLDEVALAMGKSRKTIRRMIPVGDLPAIRVGRAYRVRKTDVERILQDGTRPVNVDLVLHVNAIVANVDNLTPDQRRVLMEAIGSR